MEEIKKILTLILTIIILSCSSTPVAQNNVSKNVSTNNTSKNTNIIEENSRAIDQILSSSRQLQILERELNIGSTIGWYEFTSDAFEKAKLENKFIILYLYIDGCFACKKMEETTFLNPEVIKSLNENFVPIKFNVDLAPLFMLELNIPVVFPTTIILTPKGNAIGAIQEYIPVENYMRILQIIIDAKTTTT